MQRKQGWLIVAPIAAAKVDKKTDRRLAEKEGFLRQFSFDDCKKGPIDIWYHAGHLMEGVADENGSLYLSPLEWKAFRRKKNKDGTFSMYVEYKAECKCGEHTAVVRERTTNDAADNAKKFNRAENVRMIPDRSEEFNEKYGRRSDSESQNRRIDDHLPLRRARSFGWERQLLDLIAHAYVVNSLARHRWGKNGTMRQSESPPIAPAA